MDLSRILKNSANNKKGDNINNLLYVVLVEWGWSYEDFKKTPIPILQRLLKKHKSVIEKQNKANKKK